MQYSGDTPVNPTGGRVSRVPREGCWLSFASEGAFAETSCCLIWKSPSPTLLSHKTPNEDTSSCSTLSTHACTPKRSGCDATLSTGGAHCTSPEEYPAYPKYKLLVTLVVFLLEVYFMTSGPKVHFFSLQKVLFPCASGIQYLFCCLTSFLPMLCIPIFPCPIYLGRTGSSSFLDRIQTTTINN